MASALGMRTRAMGAYLKNLVTRSKKSDTAEPAKPSAASRVKAYVKLVITDYRDVASDTIKSAERRPFTALAYGLGLSAALVFYKKNPTRADYDDTRRLYANEMIMCGPTSRSRASQYYLDELSKLESCDLLEYKSFLVFSLIAVNAFSHADSTYERQCGDLNHPSKYNVFNAFNLFLRYVARIVDIGFCDQWLFLDKRMRNMDVNELEWLNGNNNNKISVTSKAN